MGEIARRCVASLTAAFVLLSGVFCACGAAGTRPDESCRLTRSVSATAAGTHCHPGGTPVSSHDSQRSDLPLDEPPGHGGCPHCNPAAAAAEPSKGSDAPLGVAWSAAWHALPASPARQPAAHSAPAVAGDLPPPATHRTLLDLHCALNT